MKKAIFAAVAVVILAQFIASIAHAEPPSGCAALPDHTKLHDALVKVMKEGKEKTTGMGNNRWAVLVNRDGVVCAVTFSGDKRGDQWPGSRLIAAEKANTANALSTPDFALSTGNLYAASQPGGSLYGLITTAPPNPDAVFSGSPENHGRPNDPLVGKPIGGLVVFAGGLALYSPKGDLLGALGISGDTACADHVVAWKVRDALDLDAVPAGVAPNSNDNLIFDISHGTSTSGFGHPTCKGGVPSESVIRKLPEMARTGKRP